MALELCTSAAVVSWTGMTSAQAGTIAYAAEARIANYCNRMTQGGLGTVWTSAARTEFIDGELAAGVVLKWSPIKAITSVALISTSTASTTYTLTDLTCDGIEIADLGTTFGRVGLLRLRAGGVYSWDSDYLEARRARVTQPNLGTGRQRIKVVYTGGYASSAIPEDLKLAALVLSKNIFNAKSTSSTLQSESLGNYSYTNTTATEAADSEALMGNIKDLLQPYRSYANIV